MRRYVIKNFIAAILIVGAAFSTSVMAKAEGRTAEEYMAEGIRAAYDNMHLVYQAFYDDEGNLEEQPGGFVAIWQEWDEEWNLISRTFLDRNCKPIRLHDVYISWNIKLDDDGWSEWMEPKPDTENYSFIIAYADLGEKTVGDKYRCQIEVECEGVARIEGKDFWFRAQGAVDGSWAVGNVWNDGLVSLREPQEDNIFTYNTISTITENNVSTCTFDIGFRCDYWRAGRFRVRGIEIKKE